MKYFFTIAIALMAAVQIFAQNTSLLPLFDQSKNYFTPAFTGDMGKTTLSVIGGYQYVGYFYNPYAYYPNRAMAQKNRTSFNVDFSSPFYQKGNHRLSLGVYFSYQQKNNFDVQFIYRNNARVNFAYSYKTKKGTFSVGTYADMVNMKSDLGGLTPGLTATGNLFNSGVGIAFRSKNERFYAGASVNNLSEQTLQTVYHNSTYFYFTTIKHYYLISGLDIPINKNLLLTPAINFRVITHTFITTNMMVQYKQKYIFGLLYNSNREYTKAGFRLGYKLHTITFHYAYSLPLYRRFITESGQHTLGVLFTPGN